MKLPLLLLFFITSLFAQYPKSFYDTDFENGFYPIENTKSKILNIGKDSLIFYGEQGFMLKTFDGGNTWVQDFSGTYGNILKLLKYKNSIYGISTFREFMFSDDNGEYFNYTKLDFILSSFTILEDNIYVTTFPNDTMLISTDFGKTFQAQKVITDTIIDIFSFEDNLIIVNFSNEIYYSKSDASNWTKLDLPELTDWKISKKKDKIYLNDKKFIAKLNSDLTWQIDTILDNDKDFNFYPIDDGYYIYKNQFDNQNTKISDKNIVFYKYIRENNKFNIKILDTLKPLTFDSYSVFSNKGISFVINDLTVNNNNAYFSFYYNKLIKYENMNELKIINQKYMSTRQKCDIILKEDCWLRIDNSSTHLFKSTDNGVSFSPLNSIVEKFRIDSQSGDTLTDFRFPANYCFYFKDENNFILSLDGTFKIKEHGVTSHIGSPGSWAITKDGGKNYDIIRDSIRKHFKLDEPTSKSLMIPQSHIDNKYLFSQYHEGDNYFYLLDTNYSMSQVSKIDSSDRIFCFYDKVNNLTWCKSIYRYDLISQTDTINLEDNKFYYTKDGINWIEVYRATLYRNADSEIGISNENEIYIVANKDKPYIYRYNIELNKIDSLELNTIYNKIYFHHDFYQNKLFRFEQDKLYGDWYEEIDTLNIRRQAVVNFDINGNDINVKTHLNKISTQSYLINPFYENADFYYSKSIFDGNFLYKRMDENRYKYYTSVNTKDINNEMLAIAYPNPANKGNIVNIELEELANKIEIFDLLGNKLQTINENNFNYHINTERLKSGMYLVVIQFENKKELTKFVVE